MKLHDCQMAPNPRRVRIYLHEKGVEVEKVEHNILAASLEIAIVDDKNAHEPCSYFPEEVPDARSSLGMTGVSFRAGITGCRSSLGTSGGPSNFIT